MFTDGTHCAGTAGGGHLGVAKRALIHGVKVLNKDGAGSDGGIIDGINFAVDHAKKHGRPSVFSLSLGGDFSRSLDDAIRNAITAGMTVVVAAGNESVNVSGTSPAGVEEAITVGSVGIDDRFSSFSNFGTGVDVLAPGEDISSCGIKTDTEVTQKTGTSMST